MVQKKGYNLPCLKVGHYSYMLIFTCEEMSNFQKEMYLNISIIRTIYLQLQYHARKSKTTFK